LKPTDDRAVVLPQEVAYGQAEARTVNKSYPFVGGLHRLYSFCYCCMRHVICSMSSRS
jgi:hypothetical protein